MRSQRAQLLAALGGEVLPAGSSYQRVSVQHGVFVLTVDSMPEQMVRAGIDDDARASILRHCRVLVELHDDPRCRNLESLLPTIIHSDPSGAWLVESTAHGEPGTAVRKRVATNLPTPASALAALARLHGDTGEQTIATADDVDAWVGRPVRSLRKVVRSARSVRGLDAVEERITRDLVGRPVAVSRLHGDATLGNFLFSADGDQVTGILDWEASHRGLPDVDVAHYLLTERNSTKRRELGANVADVLRFGWSSIERSLLSRFGHNADVPPETIVLLTWLHHVGNNLRKSNRYARHRWWIHSNITRVLQSIADGELI